MTNEEKKRIALEVIGEVLFQLDDELGAKVDHDRTIIVAALLEHAVATAVTAWGPEKARPIVHEIVEAAFVEEEAVEGRF